MLNRRLMIIACLLSMCCVPCVFAARQWYFQQIVDSQNNPIGGGNTAIGMRSGSTWPVVASNFGTAAMVPGGWVASTGGLGMSPMSYLDGATSNDGKSIVFASGNGDVLTLGSSGWSRSTLQSWGMKSSVAFTQDNKPAVLTTGINGLTLSVRNSSQWYSTPVGSSVMPDSFALDYDSYNQANVVFSQGSNLIYGTKGVLTQNQWNFTQPLQLPAVQGPLDLALNSNDDPFVLYFSDNSSLVCAAYNQVQGQWTSSVITNTYNNNYCIASDSQGGIGIAYVTNSAGYETIGFSYINGSQSWSMDSLWTQATAPGLLNDMSLGLVFDAENNPVISYNAAGNLWIAYDPVIIPEPATLSLLLLGTMMSLRSRRVK